MRENLPESAIPARPAGARQSAEVFEGHSILRSVVRAEGLEPSRGLRPNGFSYHLRLSPPRRKSASKERSGGFVVWTIPSP